jgi:hypothetical protein
MHAFFAEGMDKMHIPWAVEGLPMLLHLSLFLFFGGLVTFLFNIDHTVFSSVVVWIGLCTILYGWITVMPIVRHDSPYCGPLSRLDWFLYAGMRLGFINVLASNSIRSGDGDSKPGFRILKNRYRGWMSGGVEGAAEEMMLERPSRMDIRIFDWTISALDNDDTLEKFFEAIPGFFNSGLVKDLERDFPETLLKAFWAALDGFMGRTSQSNSVKDAVKDHRVIICRDIMSVIPCPGYFMKDNFRDHFDHAPVSMERLQAMARWRTHSSHDISYTAQTIVAKNLPIIRNRDTHWIALACDVYNLSEPYFQDKINLDIDSILLATLIDICGRAIGSSYFGRWEVLEVFAQFDVLNTRAGLQHDFCTLWNRIVEEARNKGPFSTPIDILHRIRHLYLALHQGTDATPTAFTASTDDFDNVLFRPSSYPFCNIASHRPQSTALIPVTNSRTDPFSTQPGDSPYAPPLQSTIGNSAALRQIEETNITAGPFLPSDQTTASEIGEGFRPPPAARPAFPVYIRLTSPLPTDVSPPGAESTALQEIHPTTTLSRPLEGDERQEIVRPYTEPDTRENSSTGPTTPPTSTPVPMPVPPPALNKLLGSLDAGPASTSTPVPMPVPRPVMNRSLGSLGAGPAPTSNPLLPAPSFIGFPIPGSRTPPQVPLSQTANPRLLGDTVPSAVDTDTLPRLRSRGLVNSENNCFANSVLQLLVHCPPFWNLFRDLGRVMEKQRLGEGQETASGATPLVDAKIKFLDEFLCKEELPVTQQAARGNAMEIEDRKKVDSFNPRYMFDAMREKRQLKNLLVRSRTQHAPFCY